jgi:transmembrane sensor
MDDDIHPPLSAVSAEQIERYLVGECTPDEAAYVGRYLEAHPGVLRVFQRVTAQLDARAAAVPPFAADEGLARLRERLVAEGVWAAGDAVPASTVDAPASPPSHGTGDGLSDIRLPHTRPSDTPSRSRRRPAIAVPTRLGWRLPAALAAAAAIVVAVGPRAWRVWSARAVPSAMTYSTTNGQRATIGLDDGSRVMLAANSRLRYTVAANGARDVTLDGAAYFDVRHAADRPFTIRTARSVTRVLGTQFVVSAYPDDTAETVAVSSGRVSVQERGTPDGSGAVTVAGGQVSVLGAGDRPTVTPAADLAAYTGWTSGVLTFRGARLRDITHVLERWYDVDIQLSDPSLDTLMFAVTITQQPVDDAMQLLASTAGLRYTRHGRVVTLMPGASR